MADVRCELRDEAASQPIKTPGGQIFGPCLSRVHQLELRCPDIYFAPIEHCVRSTQAFLLFDMATNSVKIFAGTRTENYIKY